MQNNNEEEEQQAKPHPKNLISYIPHVIKTCIGEDSNQPQYSRHRRQVFVMTQMAKPIYVRYGDELDLAPFLATLNAIMDKFITFFNNDPVRSEFQEIYNNGKEVIYILYRKELFLICRTDKYDSSFLIKSMLEFLNLQMISIVTDQVNQRLKQKPNYDFRHMLGGTKVNLGLAIKNGLNSPTVFLRSFMPIPMPASSRSNLHQLLREFKSEETIQSIILLTHTHVLELWHQKGIKIHPQDIILIQNLLQAQSSFRDSENWLPICLPGIAAEGFIYMYFSYLNPEVIVCMVSDDNNSFGTCKQAFNHLKEKLKPGTSLGDQIITSINNLPYKIPLEKKITSNNQIQHYIIQHKQTNQMSQPIFNIFGKQSSQYKDYINKYTKLYEKYLQVSTENKKDL
ncbi:hypothetical protein PPERSA_00435 [Pseudocohnilembus persalinus]|uniref:Uncharacterized protein n=1 Tax=Pseudocohnilembus persalinus TaxID=266149 RepID=A0A0V0QHK2_PSEPJ|nr:hypothetical protein PPERSA_00435 [Pseudocohnilembus persalinus]|eukprot:KRX01668.1 hypothetical protein PPERSA_00435 [Pseudocohnilembus persalinus]